MATARLLQSSFSRSGRSITGTIEFSVDFTETEARLDVVYNASLSVTPSEESTKGIVAVPASTEPPPQQVSKLPPKIPERQFDITLQMCRKLIDLPLPQVRSGGKRTASFKAPVSVDVASLFSRAEAPDKWTTANAGLELSRLNLSLDISTAVTISGLGVNRFA